jgi:hypothetical protein
LPTLSPPNSWIMAPQPLHARKSSQRSPTRRQDLHSLPSGTQHWCLTVASILPRS